MGTCCAVTTQKSCEPEEIIEFQETTPLKSALKNSLKVPSEEKEDNPVEKSEEKEEEPKNEEEKVVNLTKSSGHELLGNAPLNSSDIILSDAESDKSKKSFANGPLKRGKTFSESPIRQGDESLSQHSKNFQGLKATGKKVTAQFGFLDENQEDLTENANPKPKPLLKRSATSTFYNDDRRRERRKKKVKFKDLEIMKSARRQKSLRKKK